MNKKILAILFLVILVAMPLVSANIITDFLSWLRALFGDDGFDYEDLPKFIEVNGTRIETEKTIYRILGTKVKFKGEIEFDKTKNPILKEDLTEDFKIQISEEIDCSIKLYTINGFGNKTILDSTQKTKSNELKSSKKINIKDKEKIYYEADCEVPLYSEGKFDVVFGDAVLDPVWTSACTDEGDYRDCTGEITGYGYDAGSDDIYIHDAQIDATARYVAEDGTNEYEGYLELNSTGNITIIDTYMNISGIASQNKSTSGGDSNFIINSDEFYILDNVTIDMKSGASKYLGCCGAQTCTADSPQPAGDVNFIINADSLTFIKNSTIVNATQGDGAAGGQCAGTCGGLDDHTGTGGSNAGETTFYINSLNTTIEKGSMLDFRLGDGGGAGSKCTGASNSYAFNGGDTGSLNITLMHNTLSVGGQGQNTFFRFGAGKPGDSSSPTKSEGEYGNYSNSQIKIRTDYKATFQNSTYLNFSIPDGDENITNGYGTGKLMIDWEVGNELTFHNAYLNVQSGYTEDEMVINLTNSSQIYRRFGTFKTEAWGTNEDQIQVWSYNNAEINRGYIAPSGSYPFQLHSSTNDMSYSAFMSDPYRPVIDLQAPEDNYSQYSPYINFTYNVSSPEDQYNIENCSLYIDGVLNETDTSITEYINQTFNKTISGYGDREWFVECYDNYSLSWNSSTFNISRLEPYPEPALVYPEDNYVATERTINFTYNVTTPYGDIVNCSLYLQSELNETDTTITQSINQTFNITLNNTHSWDWYVMCANTDGYNKSSTSRSILFNNAPTAPNILAPPNNTIIPSLSQTLICSGSTDEQEDTINYEFYADQSLPPTTLKQNSTATSYAWTSTALGEYYWRCRANDNILAGDYSGTRNITFYNFYENCATINASTAPALNFSFADENGTAITNVHFDSELITYGTNQSVNKTAEWDTTLDSAPFCISPIVTQANTFIKVYYDKSGYPLRTYTIDEKDITGNSTNLTLYLLPTADGQYVTFQVVTQSAQPIEDVYAIAEREIGGVDVQVGGGYTDAAGTITMFLDPDYAHDLIFSKEGYNTYETTITPTQTSYTITLGGSGGISGEETLITGISIEIKPEDITLKNQTTYNFNATFTSTYNEMDSAGFVLLNNSNAILGSATCAGGGECIASLDLNTGLHPYITMNYYWIIDGTYSNMTKTWTIFSSGEWEGAFVLFLSDFRALSSNFVNDSSWDFFRAILSILFIFTLTIIVCYKSGNYSPFAITGMIFASTLFLDITGFMPTIIGAVDYLPSIVTGLLFFAFAIKEYRG